MRHVLLFTICNVLHVCCYMNDVYILIKGIDSMLCSLKIKRFNLYIPYRYCVHTAYLLVLFNLMCVLLIPV